MNRQSRLWLMVTVSAVIMSFSTNATEAELIEQAQRNLRSKNYNAAIEDLSQAAQITESQKTKAQVSNAIGWAYYSKGDSTTAKRYLKQAFALASEQEDTATIKRSLNNLGLVEFSLGNYQQASSYFSNPAVINTEIAQEYLPLIEEQQQIQQANSFIAEGRVYRLQKEFKGAIKSYDKALKITPNNAALLDYKGYALYREKQYDQALEVLHKAHKIDSNNSYVKINIIKSYCAKGNKGAALKFIKNGRFLAREKTMMMGDNELRRECPKTVLDAIKTRDH